VSSLASAFSLPRPSLAHRPLPSVEELNISTSVSLLGRTVDDRIYNVPSGNYSSCASLARLTVALRRSRGLDRRVSCSCKRRDSRLACHVTHSHSALNCLLSLVLNRSLRRPSRVALDRRPKLSSISPDTLRARLFRLSRKSSFVDVAAADVAGRRSPSRIPGTAHCPTLIFPFIMRSQEDQVRRLMRVPVASSSNQRGGPARRPFRTTTAQPSPRQFESNPPSCVPPESFSSLSAKSHSPELPRPLASFGCLHTRPARIRVGAATERRSRDAASCTAAAIPLRQCSVSPAAQVNAAFVTVRNLRENAIACQ